MAYYLLYYYPCLQSHAILVDFVLVETLDCKLLKK